jgi:hypothetical protein
MARIILSLAAWQAIARELAGSHHGTAPPGLRERIQALVDHAPREWPDQPFGLDLDEGSAQVVRQTHASLVQRDPAAAGRVAAVAEAVQIIHDHQQRLGDG